jgi:hypothetical protein
VGEIASVAYAVPSASGVANTQLLTAIRLLEVYTGSIDLIVCVREYVSSAPHGEFRASNMGNLGYHRDPVSEPHQTEHFRQSGRKGFKGGEETCQSEAGRKVGRQAVRQAGRKAGMQARPGRHEDKKENSTVHT